MRLLFVCTGNLCRSPLAEGLATTWAQRVLGPGADEVRISSAGTAARVGQPMDPRSAKALTRLGGDPSTLRAKALTADAAAEADLVLAMTREHRRAVLGLSPRGLRRTFTLAEAADLLSRADVHHLGRLPLEDRARELGLRLDTARAFRSAGDVDDIADPIGERSAVHAEVGRQIAAALRPLIEALLPEVTRAAAVRPHHLTAGL